MSAVPMEVVARGMSLLTVHLAWIDLHTAMSS